MVLLRSLILSASIAALAVFSNAVPTPTEFASIEPTPTAGHEPTSTATTEPNPGNPATPTDTCGLLSSINPTELKYQHVADCYYAICHLLRQCPNCYYLSYHYYVFTDAALSPTATPPFANASHDIFGELEKIDRSKYTNDHKFHNEIRIASNGLQDGHAHLALYAPVTEGHELVRVYFDATKRGYEDSIVETINATSTDTAFFVKNVCLIPLKVDNGDGPSTTGDIVLLRCRFDSVPHVNKRAEPGPAPEPTTPPPLPPTNKEFPGTKALATCNATILFPSRHHLDAAFTSDMRVSKPLQGLAKQNYCTPDNGFFNADDYVNFSNGTVHYESNGLFDKPITSSIMTFAWLELYGKECTSPLEYDAELFRLKHRLDFTLKIARNREFLWEVAAASWK
ncbi:hypothetical protein BG015_003734 [Linnemannia schmuckeri]|uniref:Uncharacterized protein n=1 Tax=Linnemannia schmuckeri TaxID=64567 RepID=A0A9P5RJT0_9FUNG|nr:hypothetical protein BG015_003734 [Linnemannia schmuckeri]